ncbi:MAG: hypothetical protein ACLQDF_12170, partial [Desulfomonilia bacterium]
KYLENIPRKIINLNGNFKIHGKILDYISQYINEHPGKYIRIMIYIDRESRTHNPPLDLIFLRTEINKDPIMKMYVLSVHACIATQMIESWFFYDIEAIYRFLKVPKSDRNLTKYTPVERFAAHDLIRLFRRYGKSYIKGRSCKNFINHLKIDTIYEKCLSLQRSIQLILRLIQHR